MIMIAFALCYGGFAALCLSMLRHYREVFTGAPSRAAVLSLRLLGYVLLGLGIWPCVLAYGGAVGLAIWVGLLSAAAILLVVLWAWRPSAAVWAGLAGPAVSMVLLLGMGMQG